MKKILILSLLMVFLISVVYAVQEEECSGVLCIQEMRTATVWEQIFGKNFGIVTDKSSYRIGEKVQIDDTQYINAQCTDGIDVDVKVRRADGSPVVSVSRKFPAGGWQSAFVRYSYDTTGAKAGDYEIETRWYCVISNQRNELGEDGYIDNNKVPSTLKINLYAPLTIFPPKQTCSKQCPAGFELINKDSTDCYCKNTWVANDGKCDLGEPASSPECEVTVQPPSVIPKDINNTTFIIALIGLLGFGIVIMAIYKKMR